MTGEKAIAEKARGVSEIGNKSIDEAAIGGKVIGGGSTNDVPSVTPSRV